MTRCIAPGLFEVPWAWNEDGAMPKEQGSGKQAADVAL
jgi:hypothetical protein